MVLGSKPNKLGARADHYLTRELTFCTPLNRLLVASTSSMVLGSKPNKPGGRADRRDKAGEFKQRAKQVRSTTSRLTCVFPLLCT
jgi:hypothetical protein